MSYLTQLTRYFRQSLLDADALSPDDRTLKPLLGLAKPDKNSADPDDYLLLTQDAWHAGRLSSEQTQWIFERKQPKKGPPLTQVPLLLYPRIDLLHTAGGVPRHGRRTVMLPVTVFVLLLPNGELRPDDTPPWIPRDWLTPNDGREDTFGEMAQVDQFLTLNPYSGILDWHQLVSWTTAMLSAAITPDNPAPDARQPQPCTDLYQLALSPDYLQSPQALLALEQPISGTKFRIFNVLNELLEEDNPFPALYKRFCSTTSPTLEPHRDLHHNLTLAADHLGQMSGEFPLSDKQRSALHYLDKQREGDILAVNGPPGTGKTTLLRSVVANLWTRAALEQSEPPLIAATSNNNQAVTNILQSFARIDEAGLAAELQGRWLPELSSYGLYFCSSRVISEKTSPHQLHGPKGEGCMERWQQPEYVAQAHAHFLTCASRWHGQPLSDLDDTLGQLHSAMRSTEKQLQQGLQQLGSWQRLDEAVQQQGGPVELRKAATVLQAEGEKAEAKLQQQCEHRRQLHDLWDQRGLLTTLLMWLPPVRKQAQRKTRRLLQGWQLELSDYSDDRVERWLDEQVSQQQAHRKALTDNHKQLLALQQDHANAEQALENWLQQHSPETLFSTTLSARVIETCDRQLRFQLFKLASHYWEGRWLQDTDTLLTKGDQREFYPDKVIGKLHRYAKLTPCMVSTFYMQPAIVRAWKAGCSFPLLGKLDLLIIDEAGQAVPDIAAASFALAKRALVVGDTEQIEPVWSIPEGIDRANLRRSELLTEDDTFENHWQACGLLASNGNVMKVAQCQTRYHQLSELSRGLYLTEHRRCYNSIIHYCNALAYNGELEALRGNPKQPVPWGTMALITSRSDSETRGSSRTNPGEAKRIAQWLHAETPRILDYARQQDPALISLSDAQVLERSVGIVTPFKRQETLLRAELKACDIHGLTVGTVHKLQGDERLLILFSSVYGHNDRALGKFYDRNSNLLNVAVSRAKDAFILFGDPDVFGVPENTDKPSAQLRNLLSPVEALQPESSLDAGFALSLTDDTPDMGSNAVEGVTP